MTLERISYGKSTETRLVECPFCGEALGKWAQRAQHLRSCEPFHEAWGDE